MVGNEFPIARATASARSLETGEEDPEGAAVTTTGAAEDETDEEVSVEDTTPADKLLKVARGRTIFECDRVKNPSTGENRKRNARKTATNR